MAVADGSDEAEQRLRLCLTNDPAMGVIRHADAGYAKAQGVARDRGLDMPSLRMNASECRPSDHRHHATGHTARRGTEIRHADARAEPLSRTPQSRSPATVSRGGPCGRVVRNSSRARSISAAALSFLVWWIRTPTQSGPAIDLRDFDARTSGVSYEQILASGGGIWSTIRATTAASDDVLVSLAEQRVWALVRSGATVVEVKSGYGFSIAGELRMLEVIRALASRLPIRIVPTLLIHIPPR